MSESLLARRLAIFPISTRIAGEPGDTYLSIAGCNPVELAGQFGTPLYLYDLETLDDAVNQYRQALASYYPVSAGITYAGKAFLCTGIAQWALARGLWLDCSSGGELHIAHTAGATRDRLLVHGVNKSPADLEQAAATAGTIVVDNLIELERLLALTQSKNQPTPGIWLRIRPGQAVNTHAHIQTGHTESKFGLDFTEAAIAVDRCLKAGLPLQGIHVHLGSLLNDMQPLVGAIAACLDFFLAMRSIHGWFPKFFCPGGGWGVSYHEDDLPHPSIDDYTKNIAEFLVAGSKQRGLPLPHLQLEPGRSLVARAGVALYRLGAVKFSGNRRWLLLDGGLADNPRPALYGARYTALPIRNPERSPEGNVWLAGPYCESGDVLIEDLPLPELQTGELIAIPASGAYQISMSSNYNGALRPAVLLLDRGKASLLQRRETYADLSKRDLYLDL